jgi:ectoine hydroxylase-related dioxygenase (phytanoyl-CoA dioxygenase family)
MSVVKRTIVRDLREYGSVDLAGKYGSTAGTQETVDSALVDRLMATVEREGFVIVEGLLSAAKLDEIKKDALPRFEHSSGRNNFEGFATQRLYAVLAKTFTCDALVEHPLVLALLDRILEPNYLLSQLQIINLLAGEERQPLHSDDAFYPWPRPRRALGAAAIWAIDEFTGDNGATVLIPGSHRWDGRAPGPDDVPIPAVMPAGSMLFLLGTLWHGAGGNRTARSRMCVAAQYCAPWCRTQENLFLTVPIGRVRASSEHLKRLLGFSIHPPFMGFIDGKHPKRLLEEPST